MNKTENKQRINETAQNRILHRLLEKMDTDDALDWIEKTFDVVDNETYRKENIEEAKRRGYLKDI